MGDMTLEQVKEEIESYLSDLYYTGLPGDTDAILLIGGIGGLLKLREQGKLAEILHNQSYPNYSWLTPDQRTTAAFVHKADSEAGYRKVKRLASSGTEEKDDER